MIPFIGYSGAPRLQELTAHLMQPRNISPDSGDYPDSSYSVNIHYAAYTKGSDTPNPFGF